MADSRRLLDQDLQASESEVRIGLSRAGVTGVHKAIRLRYGSTEKLVFAAIDCTVDLDPAQKGVHMSRFPELFEEAIDEVVIEEAFLVEDLADHIARHIVDRQSALRAEVKIVASYPVERTTPVTGLRTQELHLDRSVWPRRPRRASRRLVGVEATGINVSVRAGPRQGRGARAPARGGVRRGRRRTRSSSSSRLPPTTSAAAEPLMIGTRVSINAERLAEIVEQVDELSRLRAAEAP